MSLCSVSFWAMAVMANSPKSPISNVFFIIYCYFFILSVDGFVLDEGLETFECDFVELSHHLLLAVVEVPDGLNGEQSAHIVGHKLTHDGAAFVQGDDFALQDVVGAVGHNHCGNAQVDIIVEISLFFGQLQTSLKMLGAQVEGIA